MNLALVFFLPAGTGVFCVGYPSLRATFAVFVFHIVEFGSWLGGVKKFAEASLDADDMEASLDAVEDGGISEC